MKNLSDDDVFHVIFTRFNVRSGGKEKVLRDKADWLRSRYELFDRYCFPSIMTQSDTQFLWLVFFDDGTPEEYKEINRLYKERLPQFTPVYVGEWNTEAVVRIFNSFIPSDAEWLLTTRLDNDDGLNREFIKTLREASFSASTYFNFPDGLTFANGNGYVHRDESNAFLSYVEPVNNFQGVWKHPHPEVAKNFKVQQLSLPYAWLQVIHGGNVSNKVRGKVVPPELWVPGFSELTDLKVVSVGPVRRFVDRHILSNIRSMRDSGIKVVKKLIGR